MVIQFPEATQQEVLDRLHARAEADQDDAQLRHAIHDLEQPQQPADRDDLAAAAGHEQRPRDEHDGAVERVELAVVVVFVGVFVVVAEGLDAWR